MAKVVKITLWNKIKAEYLQGATPKQLAEKYGLPAKSITNKASSEKWTKEKKTISDNLRQNTKERVEGITNLALSRLEELLQDKNLKPAETIAAIGKAIDISGLKNAKQELEVTEVPLIIDNIC